MSRPRIVVVGSYATGLTMKVQRIPGPGETLLGTGYRVDLGGKGSNQAVGCARLGADVKFVAKIGTDSFGDMALACYREEGIDTSFVRRTEEAPTGVGFIVVESGTGQNSIVLDPGANDLLDAGDVEAGRDAFSGARVILTQLEIPVEAAAAALQLGRELRAVTILNPAPVRPLPDSVLSLVDVLTPNEKEGRILAGRSPEVDVAPEEVCEDLLQKGVRQVVMTLGENGALLVTSSVKKRFPAVTVSAVDTTGAGDAFNAGLAMALAEGGAIEEAISFATVTGAMAVTTEGVVPALARSAEVGEFCRARGLELPAWLGTAV